MTSVKRLFWLSITLALAAIAPLGPACDLVALTTPPAAATPAPGLAYEDSPFGFKDAYMLRADLFSWWDEYPEAMEDLGAFWHEPSAKYGFRWHEIQDKLPEGGYSEYHWDEYDSLIVHAQAGNILISAKIHASEPQLPEHTGGVVPSLPTDMDAYRAFVAALVDRYDGDGVNDMPGLLYPIKRWKIEDEAMFPGSVFWDGTGAELAVLMANAYEVIKDTDSEATVISTMVINYIGLGNQENPFMSEFFDELENLGGERPYDTMDIHYMPTDPDTPKREQYLQIQDLMDEVSIVTTSHGFPLAPYEALEVAGYSATEQYQAEELIRRYVYPLSIGFEKIFWSGIKAAVDANPEDMFVRNVLILADGTKKLAYYTYKLMSDKLEGSDWNNIETVVDGVDNVYVYRFDVNGAPVTVAWWDYFDEPGYTPGDTKSITLTGLSSTAVTVTHAVPAADSGLDVTDYTTAFTVTTHLVSDGAVTILLGEDPVLVEEGEPATMNSYFGVFSTHNHDAHPYFKDQTGMSEQDFYNWADAHQAILKFHWSRTGADIIWEWIEPVRGAGYDWDNDKDTDDNIKAYYAQGQINLIATISPARDRIVGEDWWLYEEDFKNYVRAIVERYDGDGIDDADANVRVKMWQASNEVLAWQGKGWTQDQYVTFVTWMEAAVHQADPDAKIMLIASQRGSPYMPFLKDSIDDLIAAGVPFDAVDIHNWAPYDDDGVPGFPMEEVKDCRTFLDSRGLYDVEIFTGENGTWFGCPMHPLGEPEPVQTEQEQARFLAQRIAYAPSVGLDHYLWNNLGEWYCFGGDPDSIYNSMGLVSDGAENCEVPERLNTERIGYWTYKLLAEALDRPANSFVGEMSLTVDNDRYGYEYEETATALHKYVLWSWVGDQDVTFPVTEENYRVTNLITDRYGNILEQYDLAASGGQLTVTIGADPLLIQPVGDEPVSHPIYLPLVLR